MKKNIFIIGLFILITTINSCTDDFEKINTDPTFPESTTAESEFRGISWRLANTIARDSFEIGNVLTQLLTLHDFNDLDRYDRLVNSELWDKLYTLLRDVNLMLKKVKKDPKYKVYEGPLLTLKAYIGATLTDLWGDVPFSKAGLGDPTPTYDTQKDIYTSKEFGLLNLLDKATNASKSYKGAFPLKGDIIYQGNLLQWSKFANSLKIRLLLRVSKKIPNAGDLIKATIAKGVFSSNADNAKVNYLATAPNRWYLSDVRSGDLGVILMSKSAEKQLKKWKDNRIETLYQPNKNKEFNGLLNGVNEAWKKENGFDVANYATFNYKRFVSPNTIDAMLINYSEVAFIIAESIATGLISNGNAKEYYEKGIEANFEYLGITMPDKYTSQSTVSLDKVPNKKEAIVAQKWIANFAVGYEGYFNHRRTGFPNLPPSVGNINNGKFPVRFAYPETEQALNKANQNKAIQAQGEDNINSKMWLLK